MIFFWIQSEKKKKKIQGLDPKYNLKKRKVKEYLN